MTTQLYTLVDLKDRIDQDATAGMFIFGKEHDISIHIMRAQNRPGAYVETILSAKKEIGATNERIAYVFESWGMLIANVHQNNEVRWYIL